VNRNQWTAIFQGPRGRATSGAAIKFQNRWPLPTAFTPVVRTIPSRSRNNVALRPSLTNRLLTGPSAISFRRPPHASFPACPGPLALHHRRHSFQFRAIDIAKVLTNDRQNPPRIYCAICRKKYGRCNQSRVAIDMVDIGSNFRAHAVETASAQSSDFRPMLSLQIPPAISLWFRYHNFAGRPRPH